ncbi:MAG: RNA polymerase sigma factor [Planctomycetes bacterium]|nr:RNA polymerase sigma factor [Planctomycetota bacterium]
MAAKRATGWSAEVEAVYRTQGRELWALFYAYCNNADRAHDALQEAFARLQEQNGTPIRDMRAWLLRVGRNWLRDVARRQKVAARSVDFLDGVSAGGGGEPSEAAERAELFAQVREALGRLKTEDREVLVLRYALGWPSQRIAETLDVRAAAVDMRLSRARRRLAELLEDIGVGHE